MSVTIAPPMFLQFLNPNNSGSPASGFQLFTYVAGTSTKQATWTDSTQSVQNANPLTLDSNGVGNFWGDPALPYKFVWALPNDTDPPSSPIRTVDNLYFPLSFGGLTQQVIGAILYPLTTAESAAGVTPTNFAYPPLNPFRYGADGLGGANDTTALTRVRSVLAQLTNMGDWQNAVTLAAWTQSAAEASAGVIRNFRYPGDSDGMLNVFGFMTPTQIAAVQGGINTVDVSAAVQAANDYLEGRAAHCILTITVGAGGSGYTNGFYPCVAMSGGSGTNAKCAITVSGGAITSIVPAGPYVVNSSGSPTGLANTHTVNAAGLGNFNVGDTLTPVTDNTSTDPLYFPSGGSGATLTVATVSVAGGKTASGLPQGGKLFFAPGYYYFGSFAMRIGAFVEWVGNSLNSVQFAWAAGFTAQQLYLGPDESGIYGFTGYYTMGSVLDSVTVNGTAGATWNIFSDGIQQGSYIRHVNLVNTTNGGIFIKDLKGGAYFKMSDVYIQGAVVMPTSGPNPTGVATQINYGGTVEINQYSLNGGGAGSVASGIFNQGISLQAGSLLLSNYQAEEVLTALDIPASFPAYAVTIDRALVTNTSFGSPKGVWVHAGAVPILNVRGVTSGAGVVAVQNDSTGYASPSGSTYVLPLYSNSGTPNYLSHLENTVVCGAKNNPTPSGSTFTPDTVLGDWQLIAITTSPSTVAAPLYNGNTMPSALAGMEITLMIFNNGAGAGPTVNFNAVFHTTGVPTSTNTGQNTTARFRWSGTTWYQVSPWTAAVTN